MHVFYQQKPTGGKTADIRNIKTHKIHLITYDTTSPHVNFV